MESKKIQKAFDEAEKDSFGFIIGLVPIIAAARAKAVRVTYPYGWDSSDATEVLYYPDGSALLVGNPNQAAFSAFMREAEGDDLHAN